MWSWSTKQDGRGVPPGGPNQVLSPDHMMLVTRSPRSETSAERRELVGQTRAPSQGEAEPRLVMTDEWTGFSPAALLGPLEGVRACRI